VADHRREDDLAADVVDVEWQTVDGRAGPGIDHDDRLPLRMLVVAPPGHRDHDGIGGPVLEGHHRAMIAP